MKTKQFAYLIVGTSLAALPLAALAETDEGYESKHAVGLGFSAYGGNLFYTYKYDEKFHIRTGIHGFEGEDETIEFSDNKYEGDYEGDGYSLAVDWYPVNEGWMQKVFFSGGLTKNEAEFKGEAISTLNGTINVGGATISPGDIDGLTLDIEHKSQVTPHIAVGWGNKINKKRGFAFVTEFGIAYTDKPEVTLTADDPSNNLTAQNLRDEEKEIEDEFDRFVGYGSVGVTYHF